MALKSVTIFPPSRGEKETVKHGEYESSLDLEDGEIVDEEVEMKSEPKPKVELKVKAEPVVKMKTEIKMEIGTKVKTEETVQPKIEPPVKSRTNSGEGKAEPGAKVKLEMGVMVKPGEKVERESAEKEPALEPEHVGKRHHSSKSKTEKLSDEEEKDDEQKKKKKKKKKKHHDDDENREGREPKRRKKSRHHHVDEDDEEMMYVRGGSPADWDAGRSPFRSPPHFGSPGRSPSYLYERERHMRSPREYDGQFDSPYDSFESDYEDPRPMLRGRGDDRGRGVKRRRGRGRLGPTNNNRMRKGSMQKRRNDSICIFYMQGKCQKGVNCPYSHDAVPPRKMELCKFYLMDCCAKKDKCLYMHQEFPCKFYHTGLDCYAGDKCKFSHGKLSEDMRVILLKHLETAPKEILGEFPRLTRETAAHLVFPKKKRIPPLFNNYDVGRQNSMENGNQRRMEMDEEEEEVMSERKPDLRFYRETMSSEEEAERDRERERERERDRESRRHRRREKEEKLHDGGGDRKEVIKDQVDSGESNDGLYIPRHLPKKQRELFLRIQQQQREAESSQDQSGEDNDDGDRDLEQNWYSSDEEAEDHSLTDVLRNLSKQPAEPKKADPPSSSPGGELLQKLGDLSKIDISPEVSKLLSTIRSQGQLSPGDGSSSRTKSSTPPPETRSSHSRDPRLSSRDPRKRPDPRTAPRAPEPPLSRDPRSASRNAEPGDSRDPRAAARILPQESRDPRTRSRGSDPDLHHDDVRRAYCDTDVSGVVLPRSPEFDPRDVSILGLPFKPVPPHTPATEIDASITSHPVIPYKLIPITIARPSYSNLKLNFSDPQVKNDPRLRKIFRLTTASDPPKPPLRSSSTEAPRGDPRMRSPDQSPPGGRDPRKPRRTSDPDSRVARNDPRMTPTSNLPLQHGDPRLLRRQESTGPGFIASRAMPSYHGSSSYGMVVPPTPRPNYDDTDSDDDNETDAKPWMYSERDQGRGRGFAGSGWNAGNHGRGRGNFPSHSDNVNRSFTPPL